METLLSIDDAAALGIVKLRKPKWGIPQDHIAIDIIDGKAGPWLTLHSPMLEGGMEKFIGIMYGSYEEKCFVKYEESPTHAQ